MCVESTRRFSLLYIYYSSQEHTYIIRLHVIKRVDGSFFRRVSRRGGTAHPKSLGEHTHSQRKP